jgi:putative sigma-54 modulation protein
MKIVFKGTQMKVTPALEEYAEKKLKTLQKLVSGISFHVELFVELGRTTHHQKKGSVYRAEVMLTLPGQILRATQEDYDIRVAIDKARDEMKSEIQKYKGRYDSRSKKEARFVKVLKSLSPLTWYKKEGQQAEKTEAAETDLPIE